MRSKMPQPQSYRILLFDAFVKGHSREHDAGERIDFLNGAPRRVWIFPETSLAIWSYLTLERSSARRKAAEKFRLPFDVPTAAIFSSPKNYEHPFY